LKAVKPGDRGRSVSPERLDEGAQFGHVSLGVAFEEEGEWFGLVAAGLVEEDVLVRGVAQGIINLLGVAAGQEPDHVEVVDRPVEEQAAGDADILGRRRGRIAARDPDQVRPADGTRGDQLPDLGEAWVEAAVEAHLKPDQRRPRA
jgi:hypothetical protein